MSPEKHQIRNRILHDRKKMKDGLHYLHQLFGTKNSSIYLEECDRLNDMRFNIMNQLLRLKEDLLRVEHTFKHVKNKVLKEEGIDLRKELEKYSDSEKQHIIDNLYLNDFIDDETSETLRKEMWDKKRKRVEEVLESNNYREQQVGSKSYI